MWPLVSATLVRFALGMPDRRPIGVKMDASFSPKRRTSEHVEMELSAGSIKIVGPWPRRSMPTRIVLSGQLNSRVSNVICSTYRWKRK